MTAIHLLAAGFAVVLGTLATPASADHAGFAVGPGIAGPINTLPATTLPDGQWAAAVQVNYLKPDQLSDAELARRAGQHIHAHDADYVVGRSLSVAYGVADDFALALSLPHLRRDKIRAGVHNHTGGVAVNGVEELGSSSGLGDATILGQYRFLGDDAAPWQVALLAGLKLPTGATHQHDRSGDRLETEHQPGTGSWDPLLGLAVSRRMDRLSLDASALYQVSGSGVQSTRLGDRAQYNLALSYRVGGERHHEHGHGDDRPHEHHHAHGLSLNLILELNGEWEGRQRINGGVEQESGGHVLYLSPGIRVMPSEGWSASLSVGVPVVQRIRLSHPENHYRVVAGVARAF